MRRLLLIAAASLLLPSTLHPPAARAQGPAGGRCDGPVYERGELSRPARVTSNPAPGFTDEARQHGVCGVVRLTAVLCRTGLVTDVEVVEGLPHGLTERAVESVRRAGFTPGGRDGQPASQRAKFEYRFMAGDCGGTVFAERRGGQLVEDVQVEGNRRHTDEFILGNVKTRAGDPYDPAQVQRDLEALLHLSIFDKTATRVSTATGARGGAVVIFTVRELPVVRDITFAGLASVSEEEVLNALREGGTGLWKEAVYDPLGVRRAERVIRELLASRGRPWASVVAEVEEVSSQSVTLSFRVEEGRRGRRAEPEKKT